MRNQDFQVATITKNPVLGAGVRGAKSEYKLIKRVDRVHAILHNT